MVERLDLHPNFLSLQEDLFTLKQLTTIAETVRDNAMEVTQWDWSNDDAKKNGYVPILMTKDQSESFMFIISHLREIAHRALESYDTAIESVVEKRPCA